MSKAIAQDGKDVFARHARALDPLAGKQHSVANRLQRPEDIPILPVSLPYARFDRWISANDQVISPCNDFRLPCLWSTHRDSNNVSLTSHAMGASMRKIEVAQAVWES